MQCTENDNFAQIDTTNSATFCTEISGKCQNLQEENQTHQTPFKLTRLKTLQPKKLCVICLTSMTHQELSQHLCPNQVNIECEYCTDATFTSTMALRRHLTETAHTNLTYYQCSKCTVAFPMRKLLEIHERTNRTHFDEVSYDLDVSPMDKCEYKNGIQCMPIGNSFVKLGCERFFI